MKYKAVDYFALIAFVIFTVGVIFQIAKIFETKSVADISIIEVGLRLSATYLLLFKYLSVRKKGGGNSLLIGHIFFIVVTTFYFIQILFYHFSN